MLTSAMEKFNKASDEAYNAAETYNATIRALNDFGDYRDYDNLAWAYEKQEELKNASTDAWENFLDAFDDLSFATDEKVEYDMYKGKIMGIYVGDNDGWDIG